MATVADALLRRLNQWGVERVYGYPGDGINGIHEAMAGLAGTDEHIPFVQARHEEAAAFMATAHAKWTGRPGVCMATTGPGAIHLLNGLYDAKLDHQPVVAIFGQQARTAMGGSYQQEVDLQTLFKDVASDYVVHVSAPQQIPAVVDRAFRTAIGRRAPVALAIHADVQELAYEPPEHEFKHLPSSLDWDPPEIHPSDGQLNRAAEVLNAGERVAILIGQGARRAAAEVEEAAELLGAGVAKALLGKDVLPDDLPYVTGSIGLLGTKPSWDLMQGCDTLLMIGSSLPYSQFLPELGQARGVQIDIDPHNIGLRYPFEVNLVGDAKDTLTRLLPKLERKDDRSWRAEIESSITHWWKVVEARAMNDADPVNPQRAYWELSSRLPDGCIVSADSGSSTNWFARDLKLRRGMRASLSGTLATMGPAVPYAIAAKFCYPDRVAIASVGDGAMQMLGNNELVTVAKYWRTWDDPRLVVIVLNNQDLNQVTWEMRAMGGFPKPEELQDIPDFPFAEYAKILGLDGTRVDAPEQIGDALDRALSADRPFVVEVMADPNVPPIPPHIDPEFATNLAQAVFKGDPDARGIVKQGIKDKLEEYLPHRD
ncbi:MAG: thiamine pyrophosphate-requiring protein [Actinobacteria bacterium]|nr:thiamine pyrophosphate-requiring protein [Actinomycetota bacterium]